MKTLTLQRPTVHLALLTNDGRKVWARPLLDVTLPLLAAWVLLALSAAFADLIWALFQWAGAYYSLTVTLLFILLSALLWGLAPRGFRFTGEKGGVCPVGRRG